jgi:hypothetical protein
MCLNEGKLLMAQRGLAIWVDAPRGGWVGTMRRGVVDDLRTRDGGGRGRCGAKKAVSWSVGSLGRQLKRFTYSERHKTQQPD